METIYNAKDPLIQSLRRRKQDELLDLYSFYLETKVDAIRDALIEKARDLAELDPQFQFEPKDTQ